MSFATNLVLLVVIIRLALTEYRLLRIRVWARRHLDLVECPHCQRWHQELEAHQASTDL